ncbi:MAG: nitroreductase family deazaflavin-dependent oxidoreductase [Acidimicrobiia bacterium]|nr:nitroreductase family deazaflavin-dependent oxidoreductase [Acidimicrobiia bacterium]
MARATAEIRMPGTPPGWVNGSMRVMLHTPLLQRLVGRTFALMTVTGSRTGNTYTIPVQYLRHDGELVVLSQRMRKWWRNITTRPAVELRIEGVTTHGKARIASDDEALSVLAACLRDEPRVAKFYGIQPADDGGIDPENLRGLLERVVVIVVTPQPIDVELEPADVVMQGF